MAYLAANEYGKSRVRLVKVIRNSDRHIVKEWDVNILHTGDYESCFTTGDNSKILPTDTMKNTVYSVARNSAALSIEDFAAELVEYFLARNPQTSKVSVEIFEKAWDPILVDGAAYPTAFRQDSSARHTTLVSQTRGEKSSVVSGIQKLLILKTANSGFVGYIKDPLTTLRETTDRLFGTEVAATWVYSETGLEFNKLRSEIVETLLTTFARNKSLSVQQTLFDIGAAILARANFVEQVDLLMPNKHCLLVDLSPFGQDNPNEIFVPTDEPHGNIHAVISREKP
jgi:urate oxidase